MAKVLLDMAMSLDGFIADRNRDLNVLIPDVNEVLRTGVMEELVQTTGAVIMGRRAYDMGDRADGFADEVTYPYRVPQFVLTHARPERPAKGLKFIFVSDGAEAAIEQALTAAGIRNVTVIGGANVAQQCIRAGLIDEIQIHLVPLLLGEGLRLFENLGTYPPRLERIRTIESPTRTDLVFRVVKHRSWALATRQSGAPDQEDDMSQAESDKEVETDRPDLVITRIFDAPLQLVWKNWTEGERIKRWWGPLYFTAPFIKADFRVGGTYLYCMRGPDGKDYWSTGVFSEIVPMARIVATDSFSDDLGKVVPASHYGLSKDYPLEMQLIVTFEDEQGKTRLTIRHIGHPPGSALDNARLGWYQSLDKFAASLK